jgi:dihydrofolate reductase
MESMTLSLIAAVGKNNELGNGNKLLWDLPAEMKYFRATTSGHPVIMGRKTHDSIGRILPNRRNIIITRDPSYAKEGVEVAHSIEEAVTLLEDEEGEAFIIGGAEIYKQSMPFADKLYITHVDGTFEADAFFPAIDSSWQKVSEEKHEQDTENEYSFTFTEYKKAAN